MPNSPGSVADLRRKKCNKNAAVGPRKQPHNGCATLHTHDVSHADTASVPPAPTKADVAAALRMLEPLRKVIKPKVYGIENVPKSAPCWSATTTRLAWSMHLCWPRSSGTGGEWSGPLATTPTSRFRGGATG